MKILHVTPSFYPAFVYGGTTQSAFALCRGLAAAGCGVRVLTTNANGPDAVLDTPSNKDVQFQPGLTIRYCRRIADVSVSPQLLRLLPGAIRDADVVHVTAVYSFPTIPTLALCRLFRKPVVWSLRGMLQRWKGTRRPAPKAIWESICRLAAPQSIVVHCTSEEEAIQSSSRIPNRRIEVIPNGLEIPGQAEKILREGGMRFLYLGRLDPIKGIENLLGAFRILNGLQATLAIAGHGEAAYVADIKQRFMGGNFPGRVEILGAVGNEEKEHLFASVDCTIVPSHSESFGMVVAESLAHGVPVIASKGTPWKRVEEVGCGLWVDNDPQSLAEAMKRIATMPLREMGQRGREWMAREFSIEATTRQMINVYEELLKSCRS